MNKQNKRIAQSLICIALLVAIPVLSNAQILKKLGKKVGEKVEREANRRADRKINQTIDKGMDRVEQKAEDAVTRNKNSKDENEKSTASPYDFRKEAGKNVAILETYDFKLGVTYMVRNEENKKPTDMTMWFGGDDYIGMSVPQQKDIFMLMHGASMITFMSKEKKYMSIGSGIADGILGAATEESENETTESFSIKKVGNERILNYNCSVYEVKSTDYTTKLWLTEELGIDAGHFMTAFPALVKSGGKLPNMKDNAGGLLLKMEGKSTTDNKIMVMEATAVDQQGMRFNTLGYTSFGF